MSVKPILQGDIPELRCVCQDVTEFHDELHTLLDNLHETMRANGGIGLAAPQIGVPLRVSVIDIDNGILELINPTILYSEGSQSGFESCLSLPDQTFSVDRPAFIRVSAFKRCGSPFTFDADGLLARVVCHEVDHMDGILFTDHLSDEALFLQLLDVYDIDEEPIDTQLVDADGPADGTLVQQQDAQMVIDMIGDVGWKLTVMMELLKDCPQTLRDDIDISTLEELAVRVEEVFTSLEEKLIAYVELPCE